MRNFGKTGLFFLLMGTLFSAFAGNPLALDDSSKGTKLLRYPDIYGDTVVFVYAGDLWRAPLSGGDAVRLTAHEGLEMFPKFSPDGQWIAFTGQYDGDEQVYVIPATGGIPKRLTYYPNAGPNPPRRGYEAQVMGWTPDGREILFRSGRDSNGVDRLTALYTVSLDGGLPEKLPMPSAGAGDLAADGKRIVYSPLFRDFRHWKRYSGGWAQYLLIYDQNDNSYTKIPTTERTDRDPMWVGDTVYFISDRDGKLNLYRRTADGEVEQCTRHDDWDLRWGSSDGTGKIVYEMAGELRWFDTATDEEKTIVIHVPHDGLAMRPARMDASKNIESFELSPGGKRALFTARGDIFTVPAEKGNVRNLTRSSDAHDRGAVWSKDGKKIAFLSDAAGEDQIYLIDALGKTEKVQITDSMTSMLHDLQWSPTGKALSVKDAKDRLWIVRAPEEESAGKLVGKSETKDGSFWNAVEVARETNGGDLQVSWSPDGRYIAYTLDTPVNYRSVSIYDVEAGRSHRVTDPLFDHYSPAWDPNGDWLYVLGQREFYPQISTIEWNFAGNRMDGVFAVALRDDVKNRFAPESDEAPETDAPNEEKEKEAVPDEPKPADAAAAEPGAEEESKPDSEPEADADKDADDGEESSESKEDEKDKKDEKDAPKPIDFEGIAGRIVRVPVTSENYDGLLAAEGFLFYSSGGARFYGRESYAKPKLMVYDLEKKKESVYAENISAYAMAPDGKKLMTQSGSTYKITDVAATPGDGKTVATDNLYVWRTPSQEWEEIFDEVWRRFRDYFYVPNMHGYDWEQIGDQYRALLPYVAHRSDLTYVLTEMISELSSGHTYVDQGDFAVPERPVVGLAGAMFELDRESGRYKIAKIYAGQNAEPKYRSPLTEVGVDAAVGDYVLAIDGEELLGTDNPYRLLQNKKNAVTWKIGKTPDGENSREITYQPIDDESNLRYLDFVLAANKRVEEASGGRAGYLHLPNMGGDGAYEFLKWYYPQLRKEGLIIDDRNNGGGNISSWILARLDQKLLGTRFGSVRDTPTTYPSFACNAHLVCLINETSASDGDIFPYYFRKAGLGPLIGKRSWGGVVGISSLGPLTDGGTVYVPLMATNDENGEYIIEGHGVDPDIEVWQDPLSAAEGNDDQLERGIVEIMKKIESQPRTLPKRPADPVKTK